MCGTCAGQHTTAVCPRPWHEVDQARGRLETKRPLTAMEQREMFRRRQGWAAMIRAGHLHRPGSDPAGRACAHQHHDTVLWCGVERCIPHHSGVYVPTPVPVNIERQGLVQLLSLETLPEASQEPAAFVPHVVWRGCRVSLELCHWLAALGYSSRTFSWLLSPDALRLIWEASSAGLRVNMDAWNQLRVERLASAERYRRRMQLPYRRGDEEEEGPGRRPEDRD